MFITYKPMSLPNDPSEALGTPEYEEARMKRQRYIHMILDILEEERSENLLQFPYRHSH